MSRTSNVFESKKDWSKIKDQILLTYMKPYLAKEPGASDAVFLSVTHRRGRGCRAGSASAAPGA